MTEEEKQQKISELKGALQRGEALYQQMHSTNNIINQATRELKDEPFMASIITTFQQIGDSITKGEKHLDGIRQMIAYIERTDASKLTQENILDAGL